MPRTTVAQAIVTWLANQYVERDGERQRFFEGVFGIFGHGIVAGMGEALEAAQDSVRYYQTRNEQAMVHTAAAFAKQSQRLRTFACTSSIGPGATNMVTGAANATVNRLPVLLLPGDRFATRRVRPVLQQLERPEAGDLSVNDAFRPVSRYFDRIERPEMLIDALPAAMRVLTSPVGDRRGHAGPAPGRPGRGLGLARGAARSRAPGSSRGRAPTSACWRGRPSSSPPRERPMIVSRRRHHLQRRRRCARCLRHALRHPGHRDAGGQGRPALGPPLQPRAPWARPAVAPATPSPATPTWSSPSAPASPTSRP